LSVGAVGLELGFGDDGRIDIQVVSFVFYGDKLFGSDRQVLGFTLGFFTSFALLCAADGFVGS
jgi:hypothetical protein